MSGFVDDILKYKKDAIERAKIKNRYNKPFPIEQDEIQLYKIDEKVISFRFIKYNDVNMDEEAVIEVSHEDMLLTITDYIIKCEKYFISIIYSSEEEMLENMLRVKKTQEALLREQESRLKDEIRNISNRLFHYKNSK